MSEDEPKGGVNFEAPSCCYFDSSQVSCYHGLSVNSYWEVINIPYHTPLYTSLDRVPVCDIDRLVDVWDLGNNLVHPEVLKLEFRFREPSDDSSLLHFFENRRTALQT